MTPPARVLGVDAAGKHGWIGVVIDHRGFLDAQVGSLADLIAWAGSVAVIAVDIPIGTVAGGRRADLEARRFVGPRHASVFAAPPAQVFDASSYDEANRILGDLGLAKQSRQSWALVARVVDAARVADVDRRVREVHPEVSFRALAGTSLAWSKKSWNGLQLRRRLLAGAGIHLPDRIDALAGVGADDVVDAAVAAWSARRIAAGVARSLPEPPETTARGPVAIWY